MGMPKLKTKSGKTILVISLIGLVLVMIATFVYLNSGNFFRMREIAYTEFRLWLRQGEIDPDLFYGPIVDFSFEDELVFKWCQKDTTVVDPYCIYVYVPPYFSSFRAKVRGNGSNLEFKKMMRTKK
jgi:hypothetical protein